MHSSVPNRTDTSVISLSVRRNGQSSVCVRWGERDVRERERDIESVIHVYFQLIYFSSSWWGVEWGVRGQGMEKVPKERQ